MKRDPESGVLPVFEAEPVGAVGGRFPGLHPIPASIGVGAELPKRTPDLHFGVRVRARERKDLDGGPLP